MKSGTSFVIRPQDASLLTVGTNYDSMTGVLGAYKTDYQLIPRNAGDIIQNTTVVQSVFATPGEGFVKAGDAITLASGTEGATIYYTTDGSRTNYRKRVYSQPIMVNDPVTIKAIAVKEGLTNSPVASFTYSIQQDVVRIHDIQGATHNSPYKDKNVTDIEGIVTYVVDSNNFYMQDQKPDNDNNTSEGVLVYKKAHNVKAGDVVKVSGQVKEFVLEGYAENATTDLSATEINATAHCDYCKRSNIT